MKPIQLTLFALALMAACGETNPHQTEGDSDTQNDTGSTMSTELEMTGDSDVENPKDGMCWKGYLGCECDAGSHCHDLTTCNPDTQMCECLGAEGCTCLGGSVCDPYPGGLVCDQDIGMCVFLPGEEGYDCQEDEDCHSPYLCDKETRSCQCNEGRGGCSCTDEGNCDGSNICDKESWTCMCTLDKGCLCGEGDACAEGLMCDTQTNTCECLMDDGCLCMPGRICNAGLTCNTDERCEPLAS